MNQAATVKDWRPEGRERRNAHADPIACNHGKAPLCPRVVSFSSGKGGVGKTNVVINMALAIARLGKRVLILDADLGLANVDIMLGLVPKYTIRHVFSGEKRLEDILIQGPGGMLILPAGSGIPELVHLDESEKLFLLNEMERLGDSIDLMLIDNAAGISENVIYFNLAAQQRVIVVTPEPTSMTDAYALIKVLNNKHRIRSFSVLVNSSRNSQEAQKVFRQLSSVADRFLGVLSMDYMGFIPKDSAIPKAICHQKAVLEMFPESKASKGFMDLAHTILRYEGEHHVDGNIKFFWRHLLGV
jgi:flagellar biosynthesis protein FlhG